MNTCILSIGTNKGDRLLNVSNSIAFLSDAIGSIVSVSSITEFPALLLPNSPLEWDLPFFNLVVLMETDFSFFEVFSLIKSIETKMGRDVSSPVWSPRVIDIDLILYNNLVFSSKKLTIPHVQMHKRPFVLKPLSEVLPSGVHPILKKTFQQLYSELQNS